MGSKGGNRLIKSATLGMIDLDAGPKAAEQAARAQQREAYRQRSELLQMTEAPTTASLLNFDKAISAQERNLARQEQLIAQIDPAILEASQQALRLLRGETSSTLAPLERQRAMQRDKLLNQLRERLGPGAETSTAGIQALSRFDSETSNVLASGQQQAIGTLGNVFGQFSAARPNIGSEAGVLASLGQNRAGLTYDRARMLQGLSGSLLGASGAQYTAEAARGNMQSSLFNSAVQAGVAGATAGFMTPSSKMSVEGGGGGGFSAGGNLSTSPGIRMYPE